MMIRLVIILLLPLLMSACTGKSGADLSAFSESEVNGKLVNEGFNRCIDYVNSWMNHRDTLTGLIPRNIRESKDYWNAWDAAADNYPFMVLTGSILMPDFFRTTALEMLNTEKRLTSRIGKLPDTYSFTKKGFRNEIIDTTQVIFGSAEYMKDGLIPLTEWLGRSPWSDRMLEILDDLPSVARMVTEKTNPNISRTQIVEINGDLLQVLSRMYWFTGNRAYLEWAAEIADYYLNENNLPTIALERLRIRDHGCEIISGLCEAYYAASQYWPEKYEQWKPWIHKMLDRILEVGRNEDGLFYNEVNPVTGKVTSKGIADNFGYTFNAYYFVDEIDHDPGYRAAIVKGLGSLNLKYRNFDWENGSCDGYADAIEGTLNLYNRIPEPSVEEWLDSETRIMWNFQQPDGMIEGWHGDGNFARTTIMYCLWKSQGLLPETWDEKLNLGATHDQGQLLVSISCENGWKGNIRFDTPRYRDKMHFPSDYPRINQFQQWFTVEAEKEYEVTYADTGKKKRLTGKDLIDGLPVKVKKGEYVHLIVRDL